jgi:hypothetical protein
MRYGRRQAVLIGSGIFLAAAAGASATHATAPAGASVAAATESAAPCDSVPLSTGPDAASSTSGPLIPECQMRATAPVDGITAPTRVAMMTLGEADPLLSTGVRGIVPDETPVWVMTVHAPATTKGSPLTDPQTFPVYSFVVNAHSGWTYTYGIGSNALG